MTTTTEQQQQQQHTYLGDDKKLVFSAGQRKSPFFSRIFPSQLHLEQLRWHDPDLKMKKLIKINLYLEIIIEIVGMIEIKFF